MSPGHIPQPLPCTEFTRELLSRVGDKWSILIVVHLEQGPLRFNELKRSIGGISQRMLTLTLKSLEKDGLVSRTVFPTIPPSVSYELTELGRTLMQPMMALVLWSKNYQAEVEAARARYEEKQADAVSVGPDGMLSTATGLIRRMK
ncbi:DNA-binding HxlR family transcriptional regulator [Duganella sp. SG902]|uniref:winged helix-turn-helix transcriptional regulator n=1 Tax=Duganella sp. SG902 TaxID=2587016 RepID=UPI00159DFC14|nr:helix-turn-helix domain-containing protein [Duganella sp. SG902]NVM76355.1 DNA-binding HxlR family transcriptional regulator [Duganella sp. SG902]